MYGDEIPWGTPKNPFVFSRALPPPPARELNSKARRLWIKQKGKESWRRAVEAGQEEPGTIEEWKEVHWGALPKGQASLECGDFLFASEGRPGLLLDNLQKKYPDHQFVLASRSGQSFQNASIQSDQLWSPDVSLVDFARAAEEENLLDFFDCRLRTEASVVRGSLQKLASGKPLRVRVQGQNLSLQQENFWDVLRADILIEEWSRPRDVVLASARELRFWLDLFQMEK